MDVVILVIYKKTFKNISKIRNPLKISFFKMDFV